MMEAFQALLPVSYTHLDVYKRQAVCSSICFAPVSRLLCHLFHASIPLPPAYTLLFVNLPTQARGLSVVPLLLLFPVSIILLSLPPLVITLFFLVRVFIVIVVALGKLPSSDWHPFFTD